MDTGLEGRVPTKKYLPGKESLMALPSKYESSGGFAGLVRQKYLLLGLSVNARFPFGFDGRVPFLLWIFVLERGEEFRSFSEEILIGVD